MENNIIPLLIFIAISALGYIAYVYASAQNRQAFIRFEGGGVMRDIDDGQHQQVLRGHEKEHVTLQFLSPEVQRAIYSRYGLIY